MVGPILILASLVGLFCSILVIIDAFQDEIWKGVVAIIFPLYLYYYAFIEFEHDQKWPIIGGIALGTITSVILRMT